MAITQTGAMYKSLSFDNTSSRNYGVYITGEAVYNAPERAVEMISIPGRNGAFALDQGRFENIEVSYPAGIFADNEADFAQAVSDFRNFVCSRKGYCRLTDEYNPNEYRMAVYKSGLEVDPAQLRAGEFNITFDCKPQRWLTEGETPVDIGTWGDTETETGDIVEVDNPDGILAIKDLQADIVAVQPNAYDSVWVGGAGKNKLPNTSTSGSGSGITRTVNADGTIDLSGTSSGLYLVAVGTITLPSGTYTVNGCPTNSNSLTLQIRENDINGTTLATDSGSGATFTLSASQTVCACTRIPSGQAISGKLTVKPMIRLSSESADYAPYSNICPISGFTEVKVSRTGKNLLSVIGESWNASGQITSAQSCIRSYLVPVHENDVIYATKASAFTETGSNCMVRRFDTNGVFLSSTTLLAYNATSNSITIGSGIGYIGISFFVDSGATINEAFMNTYKPMVALNQSAVYEPMQGDTYTIDLDGTRYGGTLDVTSGVLTVTHKHINLGDYTWEVSGNGNYYTMYNATIANEIKRPTSATTLVGCICSCYEEATTNDMYNATVNYTIGVRNTNGNLWVRDTTNGTSGANLKTFLTGKDFVYELATPLTVNLTAQEIELLQGANNVWADSGDVEVEYGNDPNKLLNPTMFESSPLLEVYGYGRIHINDDEVRLQNLLLGEVPIISAGSAWQTFNIDEAIMNTNNTIYINEIRYNWSIYQSTSSSAIDSLDSYSTSTSGTGTGTVSASKSGKSVSGYTKVTGITFKAGTYTTKTHTTTVSINYTVNGTTQTLSSAFVLSIEYSAGKLRFSASWPATTMYFVRQVTGITLLQDVTVDSTKSVLGNPTYIDCDLGEAYYIGNNSYISVNIAATIPSVLPELNPGVNEITNENTITQLKVYPRWWKV